MNKHILLIMMLILTVSTVQADSSDEILAIKKTAMNYMESWYQGDANRMEESLHPKLAKRSLKSINGKIKLRQTTASDMVNWTGSGFGKSFWSNTHKIEIVVLDFYKSVASVKVITPDYWEYLHLIKIDEKWVIVNVLYENK